MCADCKIYFVCLLHCKKFNLQKLWFEHICVHFLLINLFFVKTCAEKVHHFLIITFASDSDLVTDSVLNIKSFKFICSLLLSLFLLLLCHFSAYFHLLLLLLCVFWCIISFIWFFFFNFSFYKFLSLFYLIFSHDFQISIIWKEISNSVWLNQH